MSEPTEDVGRAKPEGEGLFTGDDVDTRMKYKAIQRGKKRPRAKISVQRHMNRQRKVK
jgi:hypothetical protein